MNSIDHIDPRKHTLIGGLDFKDNLISAPWEYNHQKSNAFVPYRLEGSSEPHRVAGEEGLFLIQGQWIFTAFMGDLWWKEALSIGYSRTNTRETTWVHNPQTGETKMVHDVPDGFQSGRKPKVQGPKRRHGAALKRLDLDRSAELLRQWYDAGLSTLELAYIFNTSAPTIRRVMKDHGIETRHPSQGRWQSRRQVQWKVHREE